MNETRQEGKEKHAQQVAKFESEAKETQKVHKKVKDRNAETKDEPKDKMVTLEMLEQIIESLQVTEEKKEHPKVNESSVFDIDEAERTIVESVDAPTNPLLDPDYLMQDESIDVTEP